MAAVRTTAAVKRKPTATATDAYEAAIGGTAIKSDDATARKRVRPEVKIEETPEQQFIAVLQKFPGGVSDTQLDDELDMTVELRMKVVNQLLKNDRLQLFKTADGVTAYKLIGLAESQKFKGLSTQDRAIYSLIEASSNMGIWIRDLRMRSGLTQTIVQQCIKKLTTKKLIKFEKTAAAKNKKVYMLYDLEPSKAVRGAPWVSAGEFDHELLSKLNSACLRWIEQQSKQGHPDVSPEEVCAFIKSSGAFDVASMTIEDTSTLLLAMVYDGLLEHSPTSSSVSFLPFNPDEIASESKRKKKKQEIKDTSTSGMLFRVTRSGAMTSSFTTIPCALCPVANVCGEGNPVSPSTCEYYRLWMEEF